jgi:hypothetical protein
MRSFEQLTDSEAGGTGGVGPWIPADVYADLILDGVVCYGQLSGVITAMEYDFTAGGGDTIQVRYISPRTHSCTSQGTADESECICLSATSNNFGTYNVPVQAWGDRDVICGFSIWEAKGNVVAMILNEMAKRLANCRDSEIWNAISAYPASTVNIQVASEVSCADGAISGSCCTYDYNLYNSIVTVMKHMQQDAYEPDYVIMNPEVAAFLYFKDAAGYHVSGMPGTTFDSSGKLLTVAGLKVIESCVANRCNNNGSDSESGRIQAVVIDSKRAVGEVWGKRPTFEVERVPECDQWNHVLWQYWGANTLDPLAIGHVINPT